MGIDSIQASTTRMSSIASGGRAENGSAAERAYRAAVKALTEAQKKLFTDAVNREPKEVIAVDEAAVEAAANAVAAAAAAVAREKAEAQKAQAQAVTASTGSERAGRSAAGSLELYV